MPLPFRPPPLRHKPALGTPLARGHPLAAGLVFYAALLEGAGRAHDLARRRPPSLAAAPWATGPQGLLVITTTEWANADTADCDFSSGPFSVAVWLYKSVAGATWNGGFGRGTFVSSTNNQGWAVGIRGDTGVVRFDCFRNNGASSYRLSGTSTPGVGDLFVVGTSDGTTRRLYVHGRQEATTTANANPLADGNATLRLSADGDLWTYAAAAWARALTPAEVLTLARHPLALLQPPVRRLWAGGLTLPVSGVIAAAAAVSAAAKVAQKAQGHSAAVAAVQGSPVVSRQVSGAITAVADVSGRLTAAWTVQGAVTAASTVSGAVIQLMSISGQIAAASVLAGAVTVTRTVGGLVTGAALASAAATVSRQVRGLAAAASAVSGALTLTSTTAPMLTLAAAARAVTVAAQARTAVVQAAKRTFITPTN